MRREPRGAVTLDLNKAMLDELTVDCKRQQDVEKLYLQMLLHMINRPPRNALLLSLLLLPGIVQAQEMADVAKVMTNSWAEWVRQ